MSRYRYPGSNTSYNRTRRKLANKIHQSEVDLASTLETGRTKTISTNGRPLAIAIAAALAIPPLAFLFIYAFGQ